MKFTQSYPDALVVVHYARNSAPDSDKLKIILGRIIEGILHQVPATNLKVTGKCLPDPAIFEGLPWRELSNKLPEVLDLVCAAVFPEKVLVFIDSIDHCIDLHDFAWLPDQFPPNFRLVLSLKEGFMSVRLKQRMANGHPYVFVVPKPLSKQARRDIAIQTLKGAGKSLGEDELEQFLFGAGHALAQPSHAPVRRTSAGSRMVSPTPGTGSIDQHQQAHASPLRGEAGAPGEVFLVRDGVGVDSSIETASMVRGRYRRDPGAVSDGCSIYPSEVDGSYRLLRVNAMWVLQHTASKVNFYKCMNATDTPPTHGWQPTAYGSHPPPTLICLTPPTQNPLFLTLALEELVVRRSCA
jgi:hypothetical protein